MKRLLQLPLLMMLTHLPVSFLRKYFTNVSKIPTGTIPEKQILVDLSEIARGDAKTGIQRVVRNLYKALLTTPLSGYRICPIAATRTQAYGYLPADFLDQQPTFLKPIQVQPGDIFLGLDLSAHLIPYHLTQLRQWKKKGVRFSIIIYDLLPVLNPLWFNPKATQNFRRWLRSIALLADTTIAISKATQNDFYDWMKQQYTLLPQDIPCSTIPLGAELDITTDFSPVNLPSHLAQQDFILMVGTIEPRKGYDEAIDAFDALWLKSNRTTLVIVGKQGWKVEALVKRLQNHTETGKNLLWFNNADDNLLRTLYQQCLGVLITSRGEGYGLPLIESAYYSKPTLVRNLPVFREIAGDNVSYFPEKTEGVLALSLSIWLKQIKSKINPAQNTSHQTWQSSCNVLMRSLTQLDSAILHATPYLSNNPSIYKTNNR